MAHGQLDTGKLEQLCGDHMWQPGILWPPGSLGSTTGCLVICAPDINTSGGCIIDCIEGIRMHKVNGKSSGKMSGKVSLMLFNAIR